MRRLKLELKLLLFGACLFLLVYGGHALMQGLRYRQPAVLTFAEFEKQKPTEGWFHIQGGLLDVADETHFHLKNEPDDV